jgi:hypothetical protein
VPEGARLQLVIKNIDKEITAKAIKQGLEQILQLLKVDGAELPVVTLLTVPITLECPQGRAALLSYSSAENIHRICKLLTVNTLAKELMVNSRSQPLQV